MQDKLVRVTIRLPESERRDAKVYAAAHDLSLEQLFRIAVAAEIQREESVNDPSVT